MLLRQLHLTLYFTSMNVQYQNTKMTKFAIPWEESDIIASYENYQLMRLDAASLTAFFNRPRYLYMI